MPEWLASLQQVLTEERATVQTCLLTHWHPDHVLGVPQIQSTPAIGKPAIYKHTPALNGSEEWQRIEHGQRFEVEQGTTLRAVHCPGHTTDHIAFVLEEEDAMFTGDNVLGHGTAVFEDLSAYLQSLETMKTEFSGRAYPAHGEVIDDGRAKINEYIAHRQEREHQIVKAMRDAGAPLTSMQIVKVVYKDVPESLHIPAEGGVKQVLEKLKNDGKVSFEEQEAKWALTDYASL